MEKLLEELVTMIKDGSLTVDGVTIGNNAYDIEIGKDTDGFDGEIKLRVRSTDDVLALGNRLGGVMQDG